MSVIKLPKLRCKYCGHEWLPRVSNPTWCPKCMHPEIEAVEADIVHSRTERKTRRAKLIRDKSIRARTNPDPFLTAAIELSRQIKEKYPDYEWTALDYEEEGDTVVLKWVKLKPK